MPSSLTAPRTLAAVLLALAAPALHAQAVPTTIPYQGVLTDGAGTPVPDGAYAVQLRLFSAATGGSATYAENHTVTTTGGVFAVALGGGTPVTGTWTAVHFNQGWWLETAVGGTALAPRTALQPSAYARSLTPGARIGAPAAGSALVAAGVIETTAGGVKYPDGTTQTSAAQAFALPYAATASSAGYLFDLTNTNASGRGIQAVATGAYGVRGESASAAGAGITGEATSATGTSYGGFFRAASTSAQAVYAQATAGTGTTYGVRATSASTDGTGVYGSASAASGTTYGVYGTAGSTSGRGVYGEITATTGTNYGVYGLNASSSGRGVYGRASSATGTNYGVQGAAQGTTGRGVFGEGSATSGINYGGYFRTLSSSGYGLYAENFSGSGYAARFGHAVRMDANMEFYEGTSTDMRVQIDVDEGNNAPALKLRRNDVTVLELDADHNGNARVITQEVEITGGADLAEHFDVAALAGLAPAPGMVVSIDPAHPGRLTLSSTPYDALVAGVVSGAGGVRPGFLMGQDGSIADGDVPVALVGRVYVLTDASYGPVRPGDLLTTSATPGHAMRAADRARAPGAVLGKAMTGLEAGCGLVLVLVGLQ
jgi:hypothetical protein